MEEQSSIKMHIHNLILVCELNNMPHCRIWFWCWNVESDLISLLSYVLYFYGIEVGKFVSSF